jgi:hypothetical protein
MLESNANGLRFPRVTSVWNDSEAVRTPLAQTQFSAVSASVTFSFTK